MAFESEGIGEAEREVQAAGGSGRPPSDREPGPTPPARVQERELPLSLVGHRDHAAASTARGRPDSTGLAHEDELCEFLPQPYLLTDAYGVIRRANFAATELLGRARWQLIGRPITMFVPPAARPPFRSALAALARSGTQERWRTPLLGPHGAVEAPLLVGAVRNDAGELTAVRLLVESGPPVSGEAAVAGEEEAPARTLTRSPVEHTPSTLRGGAAWLLAQCSAILGSSFDYELTLRSALDLTVPTLGDWAMLDFLNEGSGVRRVAVARASTEPRSLATLVMHRVPCLGDAADPIARVLCGGRAELHSRLDESARADLVLTSWGRELVERLAPRSWITVPLRARGRTIGAMTFLTARSRRSLMPGHLSLAQQIADRAALAADNARLYEEARSADEAKSSFLAVMSHELRTPLTAILGYTELLSDGMFGAVSGEQRLQLSRVRESGEHLLRIVEEVLDFARIEARQMRPEIEETELGALLDQATTLIRPLAERKGLVLRVDGPLQPVRWRTDVGRARQILVNLLGNAVKFTERGEVHLRAQVRESVVVLEVEDTGVGIPDELRDRVFEPFWQAEQTLTRGQPGTGLGLSVTRELARLLGGGIELRSTVGEGTTFTVWLPLTAQREPPDHGAEE